VTSNLNFSPFCLKNVIPQLVNVTSTKTTTALKKDYGNYHCNQKCDSQNVYESYDSQYEMIHNTIKKFSNL